MASLGFSIIDITSSANNENSTSSFPVGMSFISLSYLIPVARTSNVLLNRSGDSWHLYLVPDFGEKAFSFSPLSLISAGDLSHMASIMLRCVPSIPTLLRVFNIR